MKWSGHVKRYEEIDVKWEDIIKTDDEVASTLFIWLWLWNGGGLL
jgi:hypothetical protein